MSVQITSKATGETWQASKKEADKVKNGPLGSKFTYKELPTIPTPPEAEPKAEPKKKKAKGKDKE